MGGAGDYLNTSIFITTRHIATPNSITIASAVFPQYAIVINGQTKLQNGHETRSGRMARLDAIIYGKNFPVYNQV